MARRRSPDFLQRLLDAALDTFGDRGLKRARIADIAARMGVASGTIYNYVDSKEALFWLLVDRGQSTDAIELPAKLPVVAPPQDVVLRRLVEQMATHFPLPKLTAALERKRVVDARAELHEVLCELYDCTLVTRRLATAIEKSALDLPEMFPLFFLQARRDLFARFAVYVAQRQRLGHFVSTVDPEVAGHVLVEGITAFARHRFSDPDPMQADEDTIRSSTIIMLVNTLTTAEPPS